MVDTNYDSDVSSPLRKEFLNAAKWAVVAAVCAAGAFKAVSYFENEKLKAINLGAVEKLYDYPVPKK